MVVEPLTQEAPMTLYMDVHDSLPEGTTAADVAEAHARDLQVQGTYAVDYRRYWVDEATGKAWCLVEAPDPQTAAAVHREAHGLVADHIFAVVEGQ
jgi:leucyl aminopeptidase (aminopeptidase T)